MMRVVIVGGGAVAEAFACQIEAASKTAAPSLRLVQRWTRRTHTPEDLASADFYILAVSDGATAEVSESLPFPDGSVVAHTAGGVELAALSPRITHRAVIYPLQTFSQGRVVADFRRVPLFVEGATEKALETVRTVAAALSDNVAEMSSRQRVRLHLAAVFASNFPVAMLSLAEELAAEAGVPFETMKPLVAETFSKTLAAPSPRAAQTGPAKRGDEATQRKHIEILESAGREKPSLAARNQNLAELYRNISEEIWRISKKN
ncbi:MAG: DUF2520 domain-containing protein [Alistipes sp.]|jgi:predicted short-subunit dehydrogenase-like oxidoreductase (DUF2520 family)|nr:DUF2520 domain-containing protein [Alistipes sp.]